MSENVDSSQLSENEQTETEPTSNTSVPAPLPSEVVTKVTNPPTSTEETESQTDSGDLFAKWRSDKEKEYKSNIRELKEMSEQFKQQAETFGDEAKRYKKMVELGVNQETAVFFKYAPVDEFDEIAKRLAGAFRPQTSTTEANSNLVATGNSTHANSMWLSEIQKIGSDNG